MSTPTMDVDRRPVQVLGSRALVVFLFTTLLSALTLLGFS